MDQKLASEKAKEEGICIPKEQFYVVCVSGSSGSSFQSYSRAQSQGSPDSSLVAFCTPVDENSTPLEIPKVRVVPTLLPTSNCCGDRTT